VQYLHEQLTSMTQVRAPFDGIVMEVTTYPIARVTQGSPLFILSPVGVPNRDLVASVFVSALQGKHIEVGDEVEIELSTVRPEEHGYMRGKVSSVAILPATSQAVRSILKIGGLSAYVQKQFRVAPLYVEIEPERKFRSRTGYSWTAREPLNQVMPGSVVKVYIRVDENRPIDYLIPIFERIL
jgi:HlyD family secretion protein